MNALLLLAASVAAAAPVSEFAAPREAAALVADARRLAAVQGAAPQAVPQVPLDRGFKGLGGTGKTGRIRGPGLFGRGDGAYLVVESGPAQILLRVKTGYVDGTFTLKRDPETGKDSLGFAGKLWDLGRNAWSPAVDTLNEGRITYDRASDAGAIVWLFNGAWKQDAYNGGGAAGSRGMRITLDGHAHDFYQD